MADLDWRVVPIEEWPVDFTEERRAHPFRVVSDGRYGRRSKAGVNWSDTVQMLDRELRHLAARNILLQMAVTDYDIRNDGWIRANAKPDHPGVILTFESEHGTLSYPCDTYRDWQANVRAIAQSLHDLRRVEKHGVAKRGEQYHGFTGLPPAGGSTSTLTADAAARVLVEAEALDGDADGVLESAEAFRLTYRAAARRTHPDAGGTTRDFQLVQEARSVLERHHGGAA